MIELRPYQQTAADAVRAAYAAGHRAPLLVLPTGGGKTTIFSYVTASAAARGRCVFLLAHRAELVRQIASTLGRFGVQHRIVAPPAIDRQCRVAQFEEFGRSFVTNRSRTLVCSAQTLVRRLGDPAIPTPDLIIIDEAHHLTADSTWGRIVAAYPAAKLLPVTATPCRLDGKGIGSAAGGFADDMVLGPSMRELIDAGYLSEYRVFAPPNALDLTCVRTRAGDYAKDDLSKAVDKPTITGDVVGHYRRLAAGKRAVAFCVSVAHAEHVASTFAASGIPSEFLDGSLDPGERDARIKRFSAGQTLVLTSCDIVSEGFDLPAIEVAIMLRPTKSLGLYLQQVGRALRVLPGKAEALILDHVGVVAQHGLPDQDRDWTLEGAQRRGKRAGDDTGPDVNIRTCPKCFTVHRPRPVCPSCGHAYTDGGREIETAEGELVELTREQREAMRLAATVQRKREERDCRTLEEFIELGRQRGYQYPAAWARKRFEFRQRRAG